MDSYKEMDWSNIVSLAVAVVAILQSVLLAYLNYRLNKKTSLIKTQKETLAMICADIQSFQYYASLNIGGFKGWDNEVDNGIRDSCLKLCDDISKNSLFVTEKIESELDELRSLCIKDMVLRLDCKDIDRQKITDLDNAIEEKSQFLRRKYRGVAGIGRCHAKK